MFRGHPIPDRSEKEDSLVKFEDMPTPPLLQKAFERMIPSSNRGKEGEESREIYVNSQWALGGEGTGAPVRSKHHIIPSIIHHIISHHTTSHHTTSHHTTSHHITSHHSIIRHIIHSLYWIHINKLFYCIKIYVFLIIAAKASSIRRLI